MSAEKVNSHEEREPTMASRKLTLAEMEAVETELAQAGLVKPPDGGYGWVVVLASFFANVIVDGIIFTAGDAFLEQWKGSFESSDMATSWVTSLLSGCYLLAGPIASALANTFGCRKVTILGSLIASGGFLLSVFAPALPFLYITFGIIGGIGFGLIYLPAIVIVSHYFQERRALATGLAVCGSGIGTSVFAHVFRALLANFDWRRSLMFVAGIVLLCIICGAFFKSLEPSGEQVEEVAEIAVGYQQRVNSLEKVNGDSAINGDGWKNALDIEETAEMTTSPHVAQGVAIERFTSPKGRSRAQTERPFLSTMELRARQASMFGVDQKGLRSHADIAKEISRECVEELNRPLSRMDIFYPGSVHNVATIRESRARTQSRRSSNVGLSTISLAMPTAPGTKASWTDDIVHVLKTMLDMELLKSPSFLVLATSGFLTLACFFVPFAYLRRQAVHVGLEADQATRLIEVLGITNIVARILCGLLADRPEVDALTVSNVAVILGGVATILVPHMTEYWHFIIYCIFFGFGVACFAALRSIICVELLGLARLTSAYGFLLLFMGLAALVGTPIAGFLSDITGSFVMSFYVMGALMTLSGIICIPLKRISKWEEKRNAATEDDDSDKNGEELKPLRSSDKTSHA
uniref:Major facilitator superfamily (MFS) profile domain-containing protein n=2 Tax=Plectus sambesii TaxID=2011161 RepID=A0A914UI00_9BILA